MVFLYPHNPLAFGVMALALGLAGLVRRAGGGNRVSRIASWVLALEGVAVGGGGYKAFGETEQWVASLVGNLFILLVAAYPRLVSTLDTPWARPFRGRQGAWTLGVYALLLVVFNTFNGWVLAQGAAAPAWAAGIFRVTDVLFIAGMFAGFLGLGVYALIAAVSAFRRTTPGSAARSRAKWWVVAFGTRDVLWGLHVLAFFLIVTQWGDQSRAMFLLWTFGPPSYLLVYAGLLAYGILRTQLLDIDLKIKWGISRGTTASIMIVLVLAASKVTEFYVTREVGYVAGGVAAGVVLFMAPRINKIGEKVAKTALPQVENTSQYLAFRRLEVYQAAVQSAIEGGGITDKERDTLRRLSAKLGIHPADAARLESDMVPTAPTASPPSAPSA